MAAEGGAIMTFIFNGQHGAVIPRDVTHLIIHENITVIPEDLFINHPNLIEVYCHAGVIKIEQWAFLECPSLRRVIIPGVTVVEKFAFYGCENLIHVECNKLERIEIYAFDSCKSLRSINLPSAKIVEQGAFNKCTAMTQAIFGKDLESVEKYAFNDCSSLESITIPLKNGLFTEDDIFTGCSNLKHVVLIEGESLRGVASALLQDDWRNDMTEVLDSINHILPDTAAGGTAGGNYNYGRKAIEIREWIESVLRKVIHYKAVHRDLLNEAATILQLSLLNDAVMNNILPFVELPSHTFDGEDYTE